MEVLNKIEIYRRNWKDNLKRMDFDRIPKAALNYNLTEKRNKEKPRNR